MALDPTLLVGLRVLRPYLDDIVIAGGWVPYLYAAHLPPSDEAVALRTRDLDLAVPREVPEREKTIDQLLSDADFACEFRSLGTPPVTVYLATHAGDQVEIEFITTARGDNPGVRRVQSGLTAQELHYVDLLLEHTWTLPLDALSAGELDALQSLEAAFETPRSSGVDALLNQRPGTAYPGLDNDQFRQYAWSVMQMLLDMMRESLASGGK